MITKELLLRSKEYLRDNPPYIDGTLSPKLFLTGAKWMMDRMNELDKSKVRSFDASINFSGYGISKYAVCIIAFLIFFVLLFTFSIYLTPLSIIVFYFIEAHFLFLFPLIIDKTKSPMMMSIKHSYSMGILKVMFSIIPIAFFMIIGLFNRRSPFLNWYIGCLAIVIWYLDEVKARI